MNKNKIYFSKTSVVMEIAAYVLLLAGMILAVVFMVTGEKEIPLRYDFQGNAEAYGSPAVLLIMPLSMLFVNMIMSLSNHISEMKISGLPFTVRPGREFNVCCSLVRMVVELQIILALYAVFFTILYAKGLGNYMLLCTGGMVIAVFTVLIVRMVKTAKMGK